MTSVIHPSPVLVVIGIMHNSTTELTPSTVVFKQSDLSLKSHTRRLLSIFLKFEHMVFPYLLVHHTEQLNSTRTRSLSK